MTLFYQEFSKILILLFFSIFLASLILFASFRLSTYNPDVEKVSAYECGFYPYEDAEMFLMFVFILLLFFLLFLILKRFMFFLGVCH